MEIQKELTDTLSLLKKSHKDLENALKSRELFIASVSHELRNPLNCLIGNIELLRMDVKNKKWISTLDTCKICCEVLLGQINNVLDVAKINAEKLELHYLPINFHRLVEKAWKISAIPIKQKKIKGELRIEGNFPKYIRMDSHRVTQILLNLIGNASKFTKEGFINVSITWHPTELREGLRGPSQEYISLVNSKKRTWGTPSSNARSPKFKERFVTVQKSSFDMEDIAEKQLEFEAVLSRTISPKLMSQVMNSTFLYSTIEDVTLESKPSLLQYCSPRQKGVIKIEVVDSGCGISQEALKELFQPFKQADSSITRQFGGTGLGLYITKELIQKMGGEIFAFSTKNVGTNFCVLLPAETAKKEDVKEEDQGEISQEKLLDDLSEVRALIVDDIEDNHFILSSYLDKLGVKSDVACNGLQAVTMVKSKPPNYYTFITMDMKMPVMDGMSAMKAIRRHEQSIAVKETPIIVITANCADTEKSKCIDPKGEIRAYSFFRKPFTFDECSSVVKMIAQEKQKPKKSLKVLLVDDDAFNTSVSQEYMQKQGFQASVCSSGKEALELVKKEQFDIVLMDCEMSEMNGYVASAHIKKLKPEMLILGVTGHRREECLQKCLDSGMLDVETKPVDFKKLVNRISKLCNERSGLEIS